MIVIITGAPGSGKSKTCKALLESTQNSAWVDGDWLLATNPFDRSKQRPLRYKNIASLVNNYHESGFKNIYVSFVYARQEDLEEQIKLFNEIDKVIIVALVPDVDTLRKRHLDDSYVRVDIDSSIEINNKIAKLASVEMLDNSELTIEETAKTIIKLTSQ